MNDAISPDYYRITVTIECAVFSALMPSNLGQAFQYIWRAGLKTDDPVEDLKKAKWFLAKELDASQAHRRDVAPTLLLTDYQARALRAKAIQLEAIPGDTRRDLLLDLIGVVCLVRHADRSDNTDTFWDIRTNRITSLLGCIDRVIENCKRPMPDHERPRGTL